MAWVESLEVRIESDETCWVFSLLHSILAAMPVAMGDGVGAERGGSSVGLRQGALPVGAHYSPSLAKICVVLEAPQTG